MTCPAPVVKGFFDAKTWTITYVVHDPETKDAVVIDAVTEYCNAASVYKEGTGTAHTAVEYIAAEGLNVHMILETHAHADHLSGSAFFRRTFPQAGLGIGEGIKKVQEMFVAGVYQVEDQIPVDGRQFTTLFKPHETYPFGSLALRVLPTPGHTPACCSYVIGDCVFTGDAMFMPDGGTGRCDFPGGSADDLYTSITKELYSLPDATRVFVGHDYQPGGREIAFETTIGAQKASNIQLPDGRSREEFVKFRTDRDATLRAPLLLYQSVQVNIDGGKIPPFLKIPCTKAE
eukprot:TRINITY_DN2713_c0_g1_i1.p1 TRINITY_DN2713_c0_g1~~TRINITY_DN2713_c0_g1_i1.p1  ORF type:complete len:289 (+),score=88.38 TRINITY_DN2713_c0_g1_i1:60-926(+)